MMLKIFCDSLEYRDLNSLDQIKNQAALEGFFYVENKKENHLMIYDKKTMGKTTCLITKNNYKTTINYMGE